MLDSRQLLVNTPLGNQELITVGRGGGYFDPTRVVWDEQIDGLFPANLIPSIGGIIRTNGVLSVDSVMLAGSQTKTTSDNDAENTRKTKVALARQIIRDIGDGGGLTAQEIQQVLRALIILTRVRLKEIA